MSCTSGFKPRSWRDDSSLIAASAAAPEPPTSTSTRTSTSTSSQQTKTFSLPSGFQLQCGGELPEGAFLRYRELGVPMQAQVQVQGKNSNSNTVLVCTSYGATDEDVDQAIVQTGAVRCGTVRCGAVHQFRSFPLMTVISILIPIWMWLDFVSSVFFYFSISMYRNPRCFQVPHCCSQHAW